MRNLNGNKNHIPVFLKVIDDFLTLIIKV